ncbi:MAG TPA: TIGR01777 family oxidoreductase [Phycisphaerales bacterium]|nr:TIGR01777 family oxidoreductase [Phycisphaerales bacterium]
MADPSPNRRVVIAGASGFLGQGLARHLSARGWEIIALSRSKPRDLSNIPWVKWDGRTLGDWAASLDGAQAVVNLVGRSVDCIKTPDHCDEILRSRVESTLALGLTIRAAKHPPTVWAQMSTAHALGDPPTEICDEDSPFGVGLAPTVARAWEDAFNDHARDGVRPVILRTTFVLGRGGGALKRLATLARWGLGGTIGHGKQGLSWIHQHDLNRLFERAITDTTMRGPYIATAPNPVSNAEFMRSLRRALRMPIGLPATEWMVRLAAPLILRTDPELALYGRYCISRRLREEGFTFDFPTIDAALADLVA